MAAVKNSNDRLIVGLDIGSSKVSVIVCDVNEGGKIEVIGVSEKPSQGMQRGMVSNIDLMTESIEQAVMEAEIMSSRTIDEVYAGITGVHIRSYNSSGVVAIRGGEVTQDDVIRVIEGAQAVNKSSDENFLHVLPQAFTIDNHHGIQNPIGLCGIRLEVNVHAVTANASAEQNIRKCINLCDLDVKGIFLDHLASSHAVLTDDEKKLGVGLLDIGDETTDLSIFYDGAMQYSMTFPTAGAQITNDIAVIVHTPTEAAKKIKHRYGFALASELAQDQNIDLPTIGEHALGVIRQRSLAEVIEARTAEMFKDIYDHLADTEYLDMIRSGLVLSGGSSKLKGIDSLAFQIFQKPVRIGLPNYKGPLRELVHHPRFSTAIGLCQIGLESEKFQAVYVEDESRGYGNSLVSRIFDKVRVFQKQPEISAPSIDSSIEHRESWFKV